MKYDVIIIGGGLAGFTAGVRLQKAGLRCCIVSGGLSLHDVSKQEFKGLGGTVLSGNRVVDGEWKADRLISVGTSNMEGTRLYADKFILATGKFFSRGLVATMDDIREPLFNCDVYYIPGRANWYDPDFFAFQPFESFGVRTEDGLAFRGGRRLENLYAAGEVLAGNVDIIESVMAICDRII